jgi:hypothetical protein
MPDGNNLTIDFNDASFDNDVDITAPAIPDLDVAFPIDQTEVTLAAGTDFEKKGFEYNRVTAGPAVSSIALMPTGSDAMDEFLFEFDNDLDNDDTTDDPGVRITTASGTGRSQTVKEISLEGDFDNLHIDGSLEVNVVNPSGIETINLGQGKDTSNPDNITFVAGDTNGGTTGDKDDVATISVDASATMSGLYTGGNGYDTVKLVEGIRDDSGANVNFVYGADNPLTGGGLGPNSALVTSLSDDSSGIAFGIDEFESIQLTDNADVIQIAGGTGVGLTNVYDVPYLLMDGSGSNSMLKVQTGFTDGSKADVMLVHADSNVFLSFEFANDTDVGINAIFKDDGSATIDGHTEADMSSAKMMGYTPLSTINVDVTKEGGSGMTIDYLKGTNQHDMVTNKGSIGITVDLGGTDDMADVFTGSSSSSNDVLDARMVTDLSFTESTYTGMTMTSLPGGPAFGHTTSDYIRIEDVGAAEDGSQDGLKVKADVKDVDYIMVTDSGNDVDLYEDMTHLMDTKIISSGAGAGDVYGFGYDVVTSAEVYSFASEFNNRVYYEGNHTDFVDTGDDIEGHEGAFGAVAADKANGSGWEKQVADQYGLGK